jgi:hypothetical protein
MGLSQSSVKEEKEYNEDQTLFQLKVARARAEYEYLLNRTDEYNLTIEDVTDKNPYQFDVNKSLKKFTSKSVPDRWQSEVARRMSIYNDKNNDKVEEAINMAHKFGVTDEMLFEKNPHKWINGNYVSYGGMRWYGY